MHTFKVNNISAHHNSDNNSDNINNKILSNISFDISKPKIVAIIGESGAGKTTLAETILGMHNDGLNITITGQIYFNNVDIIALNNINARHLRKHSLGFMPQHATENMHEMKSIISQINDEIYLKASDTNHQKRILSQIYNNLDELELQNPHEQLLKYPHQVSMGQAKKIMLATVMAFDTEIIILDEYTSAFDFKTQNIVANMLSKYHAQRQNIILLITHQMHLFDQIIDECIIMSNGSIISHIRDNNHIKKMCQKTVFEHEKSKKKNQDVILSVQNIGMKANNGYQIFSNVSFDLHKEEILMITGENGAGKSSIVQNIIKLDHTLHGNIYFHNQNVAQFNKKQLQEYRKKVQILFQCPKTSLPPHMTAEEALRDAIKIIHPKFDNLDTNNLINKLLDDVQLPYHLLKRYPNELSGGQIQRISLARAISAMPEILILDEPTSFLDKDSKKIIINLILDIKKKQKMSLICITHSIEILEQIADNIIYIQNGQIQDYD